MFLLFGHYISDISLTFNLQTTGTGQSCLTRVHRENAGPPLIRSEYRAAAAMQSAFVRIPQLYLAAHSAVQRGAVTEHSGRDEHRRRAQTGI